MSACETAFTVTLTATPGAVYSPLLEITPTAMLPPVTPFTCQLTAVLAVNCCCPAAATMDEVGEIETEGCDWGCIGVPPPPQLHIPKMSDNTKLVGPVPTVSLVFDHDFVLICTSNFSARAGPVVVLHILRSEPVSPIFVLFFLPNILKRSPALSRNSYQRGVVEVIFTYPPGCLCQPLIECGPFSEYSLAGCLKCRIGRSFRACFVRVAAMSVTCSLKPNRKHPGYNS